METLKTIDPKNTNTGFTLIELLIVAGILVTLYGIILTTFNFVEFSGQARDARRVNDLLNIQKTIAMSIADNDISLINTLGCNECHSLLNNSNTLGEGWIKFRNVSGLGMSQYLSTLPKDPKNQGIYFYSFYSDENAYELNVPLESNKYKEYMLKDGGNNDNLYERGTNLSLK